MSRFPVRDRYDGEFDPDWSLEQLSSAGLARLCREYMLVSMLHDRSLIPHLAGPGGMAASVAQADDEPAQPHPFADMVGAHNHLGADLGTRPGGVVTMGKTRT